MERPKDTKMCYRTQTLHGTAIYVYIGVGFMGRHIWQSHGVFGGCDFLLKRTVALRTADLLPNVVMFGAAATTFKHVQ